MDDKEKLVELIASKVCGEYSPVCDERQPHDCGKCYANDCHISEIADHLIAHGVTVQRWIPIKDRLPGEVRILTTDGNRIYLTHGGRIYRTKDRRYRIPENWGNGADVTHWMPLPECPKGE